MTIGREDLQTLFRSPYRLSAWQDFLHRHLGVTRLLARPEPIAVPAAEAARGMTGRLLGEIPETADHFKIGFFDVAVSGTQARRRRVGLRNVLVPWLQADYDAALVAFHSTDPGVADWRVSFICDLKGEATAPKRFTYVFGDAGLALRTPLDRFASLGASREGGAPVTMEAIREAFSVEALSDEFFKAYKEHYEKFVSFITGKTFVKSGPKWEEKKIGEPHPVLYETFHRDDKLVRDYVKKMLGRLVFLHFLQKKGWLGARGDGWTGGDPAFLQNLFAHASADQQADFLDDVLENLFFNALNTDRSASGDLFSTGVPGIGDCRIPYLNGGLFEKDELDELRVKFPATYFRDLLRFFSEYNFTIDENDADEAEVGIDPEMLGRIFENLLEDNKDKGAFYTPKEIVRYMCRRSLLAHLSDGEDQASADAIATFLDTRDPSALPKKTATRFAAKLRDVKICDPAIGSGAFPMGLLRELYALRSALEPAAADLKRQIIENNIYGVDIEKGAVDIARLRFWLALVVDADEPVPLPNLDFKIMQGNSLVESWKGHDLSKLADVAKTKRIPTDSLPGIPSPPMQLTFFDVAAKPRQIKLRLLLHQWFACSDHKERTRLRREIRSIVEDIFRGQGSDVSLAGIDPSANTSFFLWHLWFADVFDNEGFDIVIGNPPYIQLQNNHGELANLYSPCGYQTFARTGDIYCLFYERGWQVLKDGGRLCFITSNKWMRAGYGENLRKFLAEKTNPEILIDFAGEKIFEAATVDTNILLFQKGLENQGKTLSATGAPECRNDLSAFVRQHGFECTFGTSESWVILSPVEQSIKRKIEAVGVPLKDWDVSINYGIKTGCNEAFIIDEERRAEILSWCRTVAERKKTDELIRPILRGRDIKRYGYDWAELYLLWIPWHFPLHLDSSIKGASQVAEQAFQTQFPAVYQHLLGFKDVLSKRNQAETGIRYEWYALQRWGAEYWDDFSKSKLLWAETMRIRLGSRELFPRFSYTDKGIFTDKTCFIATGNDLLFVLAILNSKIGRYQLMQRVAMMDNGGYLMQKIYLEQIRLPQCDKQAKAKIREIVEQLLSGNTVDIFEARIEEQVSQLFGLSNAEKSYLDELFQRPLSRGK